MKWISRVLSNSNSSRTGRFSVIVAGLILAICGAWTPAYALPKVRTLDQCRLDIWTARDGLPASEITSIAQTPDGFIWLATSSGLVRFDGSTFTTFDSHNTPGLTTDLIRCLTVRKDGTLWVGTEWGGFGPFVDGKFTPLWPANRHWHRVRALKELADRTLLVSVQDEAGDGSGIFRVVGEHIVAPKTNVGSVAGVTLTDKGPVTASQVLGPRFVQPDGRLTAYHVSTGDVFKGKMVTCIATGHDQSVWFGTSRDGLIRLLNGKATVYTERDGLTSNRINCLFEDREGCLWIGSNNGILKWNGERFTPFGKIDGLYDSNVMSIAEDREGNLWVGSGFGLNRFATTKLVPYSLTRNAVVAGVYGISGAPNCSVWCASDLGLWKLTPLGSTYCKMPPGLPREYADGVSAAPDGSLYLWFRGDRGRCSVFNLPAPETYVGAARSSSSLWPATPSPVVESSTVLSATKRPATSTKLAVQVAAKQPAQIDIQVAVADKGGVTFFSGPEMTRVENGVVVSRRQIGTVYVFSAVQTGPGEYWIASMDGLLHVRNGKSTPMNAGLPDHVHVLGIDASDPTCLWLTTDKGLACFKDGRSTMFGAEAGLPDTNLFQIENDGCGNLWIGCLHGLFTLPLSDIKAYKEHKLRLLHTTMLTAADGVRSHFNLFNSVRSPDGRLWFSGDGGITMVDPLHVSVNNYSPPVTIESAVMDRTRLDTNRSLNVEPGDGRLHVGFAALSFAAPELVRFRYRLDGFDNNWIETTRRSADYTNLPPGTYHFVVTACNNDGIWNHTGASVAFRLLPHYYETFWFRALLFVLALATIVLAFAWRMRRVVRHNLELEDLVTERTAELRLSNDQLQNAQEELTAQNHELEAARDYLEQRVAERTSELENAYDRTIEGWSFVMDLRDKETEGHSRRVTDVTVLMAEAMGMAGDDLDNVRRGALLHDIGKMGIPDSVLLKPGPLTDDEWKVMRLHPVYAYDILSQIDYLKSAVDIPWCHHEKWDGTGYPRGLQGEEIPMSARMFSIVDVWDALRSDRPYRKGWPEEKVFDHLRSLAGTHFEPELVELFFQVMAEHKDPRHRDMPEAKAA